MDTNRPLPPLSIFDKIRETDYERRKTEGFLDPLFDSTIKITEKRINKIVNNQIENKKTKQKFIEKDWWKD